MTPLPEWHVVRPDRTIVRSVRAADVREATALVRHLPPGCYLISAASHACGYVAPLPPSKCRSCGVRSAKAGYKTCERCQERGIEDPPARVRVPKAHAQAAKRAKTERQCQVAALYAELNNTGEVARRLGVSKQAVSALLKSAGVPVVRREGGRPVRVATGQDRERTRQANIRRGIAWRRARREREA